MLAYLVSVSVKLLLAKVIGFPSCTKQVPSPLWEASACTVTVLFDHSIGVAAC